MNAFEAYQTYLALKFHFTKKDYDFFKYGGKTKVSEIAFERRRDKYQFYKLAKMPDEDIRDLIVANIIYGNHKWAGDLFSEKSKSNMLKMRKRHQSISYTFKSSLGSLKDDFDSNFKVEGGQHPSLVVIYRHDNIPFETLCILCDLTGCIKHWDEEIIDPIYWPELKQKILKYTPFLSYDKKKMKKIVVEKFNNT